MEISVFTDILCIKHFVGVQVLVKKTGIGTPLANTCKGKIIIFVILMPIFDRSVALY